MARPTVSAGSQAETSTSDTTSSSPNPQRIAKRVLTRNTRQSSRLASANGSCSSTQVVSSENVANEARNVARRRADNGMDIERDSEDLEREDAAEFYRSICPVTNKDEVPFRLMELPTEIRLLSKAEAGYGPDSSIDDPPRARHRRSARATANDPAPVTRAGDNASDPAQSTVTFPTSNSASGAASRFQLLVPAAGTQAGLQGHVGSDKNENGLLRNQREDPLLTDILRVNKEVYKEARGVLYSENRFTLDLNTAQSTLACLHQRSRRQIKHIELEIPSYNDILERFQETVRLSLRYCSGLKECRIHMPFMLPGADGSGTTGNTTVYANGFDILRWLPQECNIILEGTTCVEIECVVNKHRHLAKTLDKLAYARRQLISNETGQSQT